MTGNLRLATVLAAVTGSRFGLGVWLLYYLRITDYAGVGLTEAIYIVTAFAAEIPTGAIADSLGRRRALMLHGLVTALAYGLVAAATSLPTLCLAAVTLALGRAFYSGTFEALVYDSLAHTGRQAQYARTIGRMNAWRQGVLAASSIVGGYLFTLAPKLPYVVAAAAFVSVSVLALRLDEPRAARRAAGRVSHWRAVRSRVSAGWAALRPHLLAAAILFVVVIGALLVVTDEVLDDALVVELGFAPQQLGWLLAIAHLAGAWASHRSDAISGALGGRAFPALAIVAGATLVVAPWAGLVAGGGLVVVRHAIRAAWDNLRSDALNRRLESATRATALSMFAMLERLPYVVAAIGVGAVIGAWGADAFALLLGVVIVAASAAFGFVREHRP